METITFIIFKLCLRIVLKIPIVTLQWLALSFDYSAWNSDKTFEYSCHLFKNNNNNDN